MKTVSEQTQVKKLGNESESKQVFPFKFTISLFGTRGTVFCKQSQPLLDVTTYFLNRLIRHICLLKFLRIPAANLCFRPVLLLLIFLYPIFHFIFTPIQEIRYEVLFGWFFGHVTRHYFPNQGQNHQCPLQWKWEVLTMDHVCEMITLDKKKLRM